MTQPFTILAAALILAFFAAARPAAAGGPEESCPGAETPAAAIEAGRSRGWDMESIFGLRLAAARYYECLAWGGRGEAACGELEAAVGGGVDSAAGFCLDMYSFHSSIRLSVAGEEAKAREHCRAYLDNFRLWMPLPPETADQFCGELYRAYRARAYPVCARLAARLKDHSGVDFPDFLFHCRTSLYPDAKSCGELRNAEDGEQCLTDARVLEAFRSGDPGPCGGDAACLAVASNSPAACGALAKQLAGKYCARAAASERAGGGPK